MTEAEFNKIDLDAECARCNERAGEHKYDASCPVYATFGDDPDYLAGFHYLTFTAKVDGDDKPAPGIASARAQRSLGINK